MGLCIAQINSTPNSIGHTVFNLPGMGEPQPLQDVVDTVGLDLAARPRDESDGGLEMPLQ